MTWIKTIPFGEARGRLRKLYDRIVSPDGHIDNIMMAHSLRPHTLEGHMALYKNVLHHAGNSLPKWLLEAAGAYASVLNGCAYCVEHHFTGLARLLDDGERAAAIRSALGSDSPGQVFEGKELAVMAYVRKLTVEPAAVDRADIEALRAAGLDDGEILELNQVTAYFAYANRTVLGLGCELENSAIGLSPNDSTDEANWSHQ